MSNVGGIVADRDLRVSEFIKLYEAHGCTVTVTRRQKIIVLRHHEGGVLRFMQHAHKGLHDTFERRTVQASRRRLRYSDVPDEEFYGPLD